MNIFRHCAFASALALLAGCASLPASRKGASMFSQPLISTHRDADDLLTGGVDWRVCSPSFRPPLAMPNPTAAELRRRALWSNWRGIADLAPGGGYATLYGSVATVPPGARIQCLGHAGRCQAAASGAAAIAGWVRPTQTLWWWRHRPARAAFTRAIAVAGAWGLPRGCAVAYTDKGNGTGGLIWMPGKESRWMAAWRQPMAIPHWHSSLRPLVAPVWRTNMRIRKTTRKPIGASM